MAFRSSSRTSHEHFDGKHRFEHWYRDNTVYFITAKVRGGFHAFETEKSKAIFWDRFDFYAPLFGYVPWITSLLDNHYHTLGYLEHGEALGEFMRKLHGSVAWMVMKEIEVRHVPFWRNDSGRDYFDGCIRDVLQATRAYRYTQMQAVRAGIVSDWHLHPHTRAEVDLNFAIERAVELNAFMSGVPYARYEKKHGHRR